MTDSYNSSNGSVAECSVVDTYPFVVVPVVSSGSAMVSALCCIFVIGLIFLLKKHYFFIQRIILYHCLAALFRSVALMTRFYRLAYNEGSTSWTIFCMISGFLDQVTFWYLMVDYYVITFTLLMTAVFHKNVSRLEGLYVVLIFIFPLTFNWIPFINNTYGKSEEFCWIRNKNFDDCSEHKFGYILQLVLWYIPFYIFLILVIPTYVSVIVITARQRWRWRGRSGYDSRTESDTLIRTLNEEVWPLLFFPFGVLALNIVPLATGIYDTIYINNPLFGLHLATAIISPLQGGYIALVYTLNRHTLRRLTYSNLVATLCTRKGRPTEYPIESCADLSETYDSNASRASTTNYKKYTDDDKQTLLHK